jgi:hypothetical protein
MSDKQEQARADDEIPITKLPPGWAGVPNGQEIPMSKIKQGERSPDPAVRKEARFADNARHLITRADAVRQGALGRTP